MRTHITIVALLLTGFLHIGKPVPAGAADFSDPEWPCIQRKVDQISIGQMWPHSIDEVSIPDFLQEDATLLASRLVLRRFTSEESKEFVEEFVQKISPESYKQILGQVYSEVFESISQRRNEVMEGIARYATKQSALTDQIDTLRAEMTELSKKDSPDFDRIDKLEEQLDWDQRIFEERAKSLTYVCEVPVLLEKHAYSIAQILLGQLPN